MGANYKTAGGYLTYTSSFDQFNDALGETELQQKSSI